MFTKRQTFEIVKAHLLSQNKVSGNGQGDCFYRDPDNLRCAVGYLIPDDKYNPEFEGYAIYEQFTLNPTNVGLLIKSLGHDLELCRKLQIIHDSKHVCLWEEELNKLEKKLD